MTKLGVPIFCFLHFTNISIIYPLNTRFTHLQVISNKDMLKTNFKGGKPWFFAMGLFKVLI
jgi:hypothetical protein